METNNVLYHYCSLAVFKSIIENKSIWLSNIIKSNDSLEIEWLLNRYIDFLNKKTSNLSDSLSVAIKNEVTGIQTLKKILLEAVPIYVTCFSEKGDDLSQWRGYGDDGYGIAIGFDSTIFSQLKDKEAPSNYPYLFQIVYGSEEYLNDFFESLINRIDTTSSAKNIEDQLIEIKKEIINNAPHYKNYNFIDEAEWRLCFWSPKEKRINFTDNAFSSAEHKFFTRRDDLVSYYEVKFTNIQKAINHIYIGPKSKIKKQEIQQFLSTNDIKINDPNHKIIVEKSNLSYR